MLGNLKITEAENTSMQATHDGRVFEVRTKLEASADMG